MRNQRRNSKERANSSVTCRSSRCAPLAVRDRANHEDGMAIELVPFELIRGVCIHTRHAEGASVGFTQRRAPEIIAAETLLRAAMSPAHDAG